MARPKKPIDERITLMQDEVKKLEEKLAKAKEQLEKLEEEKKAEWTKEITEAIATSCKTKEEILAFLKPDTENKTEK